MESIEKLSYIQTHLKAPKNKTNNFGHYKYRSCEDILESVKPLLAETKTALIISDEVVNIGDRYYIKATALIRNAEKDNDGMLGCSVAYAREENEKKGMDSAQLTGATSSYARKYALNGLFAIDDTEDFDAISASAPEVKTQKVKQPVKITYIYKEEEKKRLEPYTSILNDKEKEELRKYYQKVSINELIDKAIKITEKSDSKEIY